MRRQPGDASKTVSLGLLLVVSAVVGVLVAGLIAPVIGGLGLAGRAVADTITLPLPLQEKPLDQRTRILAADGSLIADFYDQNRTAVTLAQVPLVAVHALLAVEDSRFYEHHGVDPQGIGRALVLNSSNGGVQGGGSTITQQYVKNVLFNAATTDQERKDATGQSLKRKIREARYALALEKTLSKNQILEDYLNIAYFGAGAYGVGSAAQRFFSVPVSKLTLTQSALIMGLVKNPSGYDPTRHPVRALERRNIVLQRMHDVGYLNDADLATALAAPLGLNQSTIANGCSGVKYAGLCSYVQEAVLNDPQFGATREDRTHLLYAGGVTIRTTLQPKLQDMAQSAIDKTVAPDTVSPAGQIGTALATVQPGTGNVLALAQNVPYGEQAGQTTILFSTGTGSKSAAGGASPGFQPGSTFKLFVLTAALENGLPLSTQINSPATYHPKDSKICKEPSTGFHNAGDSEAGVFDMWSGTAKSVNTFYVQLEERIGGIASAVSVARRLGLDFSDPVDAAAVSASQNCSFTLGTASEWPLTMANAYATIAAHGMYCVPRVIDSVTFAGGDTHQAAAPNCNQAIAPQIADSVAAVLRGPIENGTATANAKAIGRPAAGKTGTTESNKDAWFVGFTPQLSTAVWLGHPDGESTLDAFRTLDPAQDWGPSSSTKQAVFGGTIPTIIWERMMAAALANMPVLPLPEADPGVAHGSFVVVPSLTDLQGAQALAQLTQAGLTGVLGTTPVPSDKPAGVVVSSNPGAGSRVPVGSTVTVNVSSGVPPTPTATPSATDTPTITPTVTPTITPTITPTATVTDTPSATATATATPTPTATTTTGGIGH